MAAIEHNEHAYLTTAQAADIYSVSRATVRQHALSLGAVRVGGQWRFPYPDRGETIRTSETDSARPHFRRTR